MMLKSEIRSAKLETNPKNKMFQYPKQTVLNFGILSFEFILDFVLCHLTLNNKMLAIDIGNTNITFGIFSATKRGGSAKIFGGASSLRSSQ